MHDWYMLEMTNSLIGMRSAMRPERRFFLTQEPISGGGRLDAYRSTLCQNLCGAIYATDQRNRQAMCPGRRCFTVSGTCELETANLPRHLDGSRKYGRWIALHAITRQLLRVCRSVRWLYMLLFEKVLVV